MGTSDVLFGVEFGQGLTGWVEFLHFEASCERSNLSPDSTLRQNFYFVSGFPNYRFKSFYFSGSSQYLVLTLRMRKQRSFHLCLVASHSGASRNQGCLCNPTVVQSQNPSKFTNFLRDFFTKKRVEEIRKTTFKSGGFISLKNLSLNWMPP